MKNEGNFIRLSASDLSNHLDCAHITTLDYGVATGRIAAPEWTNPDTAVLRQLGFEHEQRYVKHLADSGLSVVDLRGRAAEETVRAMKSGVDVITQAVLADGRWLGRADLLRRVETASSLGAWSYEVYDCKLARETKGATILQLSLYSDLVAKIQQTIPRFMYVVSPSETFAPEPFAVADYAAYYRLVKSRLEQAVDSKPKDDATVNEPNAHCGICSWWKKCDGEWRRADHLSLVAGISRLQRKQVNEWNVHTMAQLAKLDVSIQPYPAYGSRGGYVRVREQARMQVKGRESAQPEHEIYDNTGLALLPEPSAGDIFFDLEGDSFVGNSGMEYLFGFIHKKKDGPLTYERRWCLNPAQEKSAFEWFVDAVMQIWSQHPGMHIYHFTAREPSALKRLMGKYATREEAVDRILRGQLLVDLHRVLKQSVRAGVEDYSLKTLEPFYGFVRGTSLDDARMSRRRVEHGLELGRPDVIDEASQKIIEGYNCDDCSSTESLRNWLEGLRSTSIAEGSEISRPTMQESAAPPAVDARQKRVADFVGQLMEGIPIDPTKHTEEQHAKVLLANLLDWYRREERAEGQEYYRLLEMTDEEYLHERAALYGLEYLGQVPATDGTLVDRYRFDQQDTSIRAEHSLHDRNGKVGNVTAINLSERTIDIEKTAKMQGSHPSAVFVRDDPRKNEAGADALCSLAEWVIAHGVDSVGSYRSVRNLLLRRRPMGGNENLGSLLHESEGMTDAAKRIALKMDSSVLAIQGPPGSGKTFTGAQIICELIRQGKKVGITATPHRVIAHLFEEVLKQAKKQNVPNVRCLHKVSKKHAKQNPEIQEATDNKQVVKALETGRANVIGGTSWLWARPELFEKLDVLVVDEAAQMSLANVLAAGQCAKNLVLLGDPRQLDQPLQGSHPDGAEVSSLGHMLGGTNTISPDLGLFLPETRRLHPKICHFTSELFYDGLLQPVIGLERQLIKGHSFLPEAGLCFASVPHEGNPNASREEVDVVEALVKELLTSGTTWFNPTLANPSSVPLTTKDILLIAPYNAQVSDISVRLPGMEVGTVDRFQGREAAVVIYSLTTSSQEEAPRGMEFLYSLNRLNVATSRGRALCIVVGSPRLLEPQCRTPRQMQLANALCRFAELARKIEVTGTQQEGYKFNLLPAA